MVRALDPEHVQVLSWEAALAREPAEKVRLYRRILQKEPLNELARGMLCELGGVPVLVGPNGYDIEMVTDQGWPSPEEIP